VVTALATRPGSGVLGWLIDQFVATTPGTRHAVAVGIDGALLGASTGLDPAATARMADLLENTVQWTSSAAAWVSGPPVVSCLLTEDGGLLLVLPIPGGGALAVVADGASDAGQVGYEATLVAGRLGDAATARRGPPARPT
jgi:predicted regulator of Ras-like GTPase activity (Roadblock/LC7/MglB family)